VLYLHITIPNQKK